MTQNRLFKGFWWLPEQPGIRWFGTLKLAPGHSPTLEVIMEGGQPFMQVDVPNRVVHGCDEHGNPVTLLFVSQPSSSFSGAMTTLQFHAGYALLGIAVPTVESFLVHDLRLEVQHLYRWLGISGFTRPNLPLSEAISIGYRQPTELRFKITPELQLLFGWSFCMTNGDKCKTLREEASVSFQSQTGFSLRQCFDLVNTVRMLLHLAVLRPIYPVVIEARKEGYGREISGQWLPHDIEIWGSNLKTQTDDDPIGGVWTFRFQDLQQNFATFFSTWLDYLETQHEALGCYSSTIYHSLTSEITLLSRTQALDAYHGTKFHSHQTRTGFKGKIEQLANAHPPFLGLVSNVSEFAEQVQATRNYYTHHNPHWLTTGKVAKGADLIRLNEKLKVLIQMCVLADIGIPTDRLPQLRRQFSTQIVSME